MLWQFGIFLHGPLMRQEDNDTPGETIPPIYFSASFKNKVWRLSDVATDQPSAGNWTGSLTLMGDAVAPSTTYPITDSVTKKLKGLFVAEGNPFAFNHLNGTMSMSKGGSGAGWVGGCVNNGDRLVWVRRNAEVVATDCWVSAGGVTYMGDDSGKDGKGDQCTAMFPTATWHPWNGLGQVVNTVDCHVPSGMCFFSVWKVHFNAISTPFHNAISTPFQRHINAISTPF